MQFQTFWRGLNPDAKEQFAGKADTSVGYLHLIAGSHRRPSPEMAKRLVTASDGELTLSGLRPDIWDAA